MAMRTRRGVATRAGLALVVVALLASLAQVAEASDATDPGEVTTTVAGPPGQAELPALVAGTASDPDGIRRVMVTVKDRESGRYWNPTTRRWQASWRWDQATLGAPGATTTTWSYRFAPGRRLGSGRYRVSAVGRDSTGATDPTPARRTFTAAPPADDPVTQIATPTPDEQVATWPFTIGGTATDRAGISRVKLTVKDVGTGEYWNPVTQDWQTEWLWYDTAVDRAGAPTATWSFSFDPRGNAGSGRYRAAAVAWDTTGVQDPTPHKVTFEQAGAPTPDPDERALVWADEFNGTAVDPQRWKVFSGSYGNPYRLQDYTARSQNVRVQDGALVLEARAEASNGQGYTSGMVVSNDVRRADAGASRGNLAWTHGRFEMRARLPDVSGLWPAFWLRPLEGAYGGWPRSGEIDVLEYPGPTPTSWRDRRLVHNVHWYSATAHDNDAMAEGEVRIDAAWLSQFHTFAVEWDAGGFRWYVDGRLTHQASGGWSAPGAAAPAPFDRPFFITLNLQVGGWAGTPSDPQFPGRFEIDWVRVYQ